MTSGLERGQEILDSLGFCLGGVTVKTHRAHSSLIKESILLLTVQRIGPLSAWWRAQWHPGDVVLEEDREFWI